MNRTDSEIRMQCVRVMAILLSCLVILLSLSASATVTNIVWYHFGESDPGAVSGGTITNTVDSVASNNLTFHGSPYYTNNVAAAAAAHANSTLSAFIPTGAFATTNVVSTVVDNFGIEAWVKPTEVTNGQTIAYNGSTAASGWGLILGPNDFYGLYGGQAVIDAGPASTNVWTHVALVRASGVTSMYINGVAVVTNNAIPGANPAGNFAVGAPPQSPFSQFYSGGIDELRVFTFAPGQFSTNDLLVNLRPPIVPIVTTLADDGSPGSLRYVLTYVGSGITVTFATNGQISLTNGSITLPGSVNLIGPGPTNLVVSGNNSNRVFISNPETINFLSGLSIWNGQADTNLNGEGGGIYNTGQLTLSNCDIGFNMAQQGPSGRTGTIATPGDTGAAGGAIFNSGSLEMIACFVHNNLGGTGGVGGNTSVTTGNNPGPGGSGGSAGALYNSGAAMLLGCAFYNNSGGTGGPSGNITTIGGPVSGGVDGNGGPYGAIYNDTNGQMTVVDCTIDSNSAGAAATGGLNDFGTSQDGLPGTNGGIGNAGLLEMFNDTITRNNGYTGVGGIYNIGEATAQNTIIALNAGSISPDYSGDFSTQGHNLIGNDEGSFGFFAGNDGDIVGTSDAPIDPVIGPFANNGGLTGTVALLHGSPAIDAGSDTVLGPPNDILTDARGEPRKSGAHVDIGAYETIVGSAPVLTNLGMHNQMYGLAFTNTPYAGFTVLSSSNVSLPLSNWTIVGPPVESPPGQFQFFDPSATNNPQQFYRVSSP